MINKNKSSILFYLGYFIAGVMLVPFMASCGKQGTTLGTDNAYINIVNVSPDVRPFNLYANFVRQGLTTYSYPNASGYFLQNIIDTPLQIRPVLANNISTFNLLTLGQQLQTNIRYTWFVTGLRADSSNALTTVFTVDSGKVPKIGRGAIRFVNVSPNAPGLNITANDTVAFKNITYKKVSDYTEVTAGTYNLNVSATSAPSTVLKSLPNVTVLDGKLYTVYAYGLVGRTDTAAFNLGIILNTIPDKK
jgi:hypothetical protein